MPMIRKRSIEMTRVFNATRGRVAIAQRDANSPPISLVFAPDSRAPSTRSPAWFERKLEFCIGNRDVFRRRRGVFSAKGE